MTNDYAKLKFSLSDAYMGSNLIWTFKIVEDISGTKPEKLIPLSPGKRTIGHNLS